MRSLRLAFVSLALCALACAHPQSSRAQECVEFEPPRQVLCHVGGKPLVSGLTKTLCRRFAPERWVLTDSADEAITVIGGECFTIINGAF